MASKGAHWSQVFCSRSIGILEVEESTGHRFDHVQLPDHPWNWHITTIYYLHRGGCFQGSMNVNMPVRIEIMPVCMSSLMGSMISDGPDRQLMLDWDGP